MNLWDQFRRVRTTGCYQGETNSPVQRAARDTAAHDGILTDAAALAAIDGWLHAPADRAGGGS